MKRLSSRFAWLIVIVAVILATVVSLRRDAGAWVWVPVAIAFLAIGALLGGDSADSTEGGDSSDSGNNGDSGGDGGGD